MKNICAIFLPARVHQLLSIDPTMVASQSGAQLWIFVYSGKSVVRSDEKTSGIERIRKNLTGTMFGSYNLT